MRSRPEQKTGARRARLEREVELVGKEHHGQDARGGNSREGIAELKAEAAKATGEAKPRPQKQIDAASAGLQGLQARAKTANGADRQQLGAKLRVLQDRSRGRR